MTDRTDPRVDYLADVLIDAWLQGDRPSGDPVEVQAARILATLDRLAWRDVATDPPPDDWIGIVSDDGKWWREISPPPGKEGEA